MAFQITQQGRQICVSQETFPIILQSLPFPRYPSDRACLQAANETHQVPDGITEDDQQTDTPSICFQNSNKVRQALGWEKKWSLHGCLLLQNFLRFLARSSFCCSLLFPVSSSDCLTRQSESLTTQSLDTLFFLVRKSV